MKKHIQTIEPEFIGMTEVCQRIGMPRRTLEDRISEGKVPFYRFGRSRLFRVGEVIKAIEATRVAPRAEVIR